ncbi:MAG TPA: hypothetical protein VNJ04_12290 [Gemmatimonadaceae bacterium]|nr:hypothetical protein [Gemmatimonadaceae bacterium]
MASAPLGSPNLRIIKVHPSRAGVDTIATVFLRYNQALFVSADERLIASGHTLIDTRTGVRIELPNGQAHGFSPDGTQLLYEVFGSASAPTRVYTLVSTGDGTFQPMLGPNGYFDALRWSGNAPQLLTVANSFANPPAGTRVFELDGLSGATRDLAQFSERGALYTANWSDDGQTLGVWLEPNYYRSKLVIIRGGSALVTVLRVDADVGSPIFSPDGTALV